MATPRTKRPAAPRRAAEPQVATQPTAASEPPPMDFSGVTLSNDGASWSSPTGNGETMTGPIGAPARAEHVGPVHRTATGTSTERVVAVGDLSRPPRAPNLDAALAANYPSDARAAGTTGTAVVRARILADGRVGTMRVVSESVPGFGTACQRTLAGSHWEPPLDASSRPVITDISYTCTFAVTR
jgi:outer membrane biosynthesis protein TonB